MVLPKNVRRLYVSICYYVVFIVFYKFLTVVTNQFHISLRITEYVLAANVATTTIPKL